MENFRIKFDKFVCHRFLTKKIKYDPELPKTETKNQIHQPFLNHLDSQLYSKEKCPTASCHHFISEP